MKLIIQQGKRARQIDGPYNLCASREDFQQLHQQLTDWLAEPGNGYGISYGWLYVTDRAQLVHTHAEPWNA